MNHLSQKTKPTAMISQPMRGLSDVEIQAARDDAIYILEEKGYTVLNTFFSDNDIDLHGVKNPSLSCLAKAIEVMALCDAVYFCDGWEDARGCCIEHEIAEAYGLKLIYEGE